MWATDISGQGALTNTHEQGSIPLLGRFECPFRFQKDHVLSIECSESAVSLRLTLSYRTHPISYCRQQASLKSVTGESSAWMGCPLNHLLFRSITAFSASSSLRNYKVTQRERERDIIQVPRKKTTSLVMHPSRQIYWITMWEYKATLTFTYTFPTKWSPRLSHMFISSTSPYFSSISENTSWLGRAE